MASLSFDQVAHLYDETRGYPPAVAQRVARAIDAAVNATEQTTFLEIGAGTGRIGYPLASLGRIYTGLDISEKMLARFEEKLRQARWLEHGCDILPWGSLLDEQSQYAPLLNRFTCSNPPSSIRLVQADAEALPFRSDSFDVALAIHVFHLMDHWQQALRELIRVLRPQATLLLCRDDWGTNSGAHISKRWQHIVQELGGKMRNVHRHVESEIVTWLQQQDIYVTEYCACAWEREVIPQVEIDMIARRSYSRSWDLPEPLFTRSIELLKEWASSEFGDLTQTIRDEQRFMIVQAQLPYRLRNFE